MARRRSLIPAEVIQGRILCLRGRRVMLDSDLAELYGVETKALNRAVSRNPERFPEDFMFQLTEGEFRRLRCQIGTSNRGRGGRRYPPFVFTEHGAVMAANVLNSRRAVETSVLVVRAFVRLRKTLSAHGELAGWMAKLEGRVSTHDRAIRGILSALRRLMESPSESSKPRIGFHRR
jgi:phage regulator Rha-like protein